MGTVTELWKRPETEVLNTLNRLRDAALIGQIQGLMYVIDRANRHTGGMAGSYRNQPNMAVEIATKSMQKLYAYEARKRIDPLTASDYVG